MVVQPSAVSAVPPGFLSSANLLWVQSVPPTKINDMHCSSVIHWDSNFITEHSLSGISFVNIFWLLQIILFLMCLEMVFGYILFTLNLLILDVSGNGFWDYLLHHFSRDWGEADCSKFPKSFFWKICDICFLLILRNLPWSPWPF